MFIFKIKFILKLVGFPHLMLCLLFNDIYFIKELNMRNAVGLYKVQIYMVAAFTCIKLSFQGLCLEQKDHIHTFKNVKNLSSVGK